MQSPHLSAESFSPQSVAELEDLAAKYATALKELELTAQDLQSALAELQNIKALETPHVGVAAHVFSEEGKLLVVQRADSKRWYVPSGWCDVGQTPPQNAVREVEEETGLLVKPIGLLEVETVHAPTARVKHWYRHHILCSVTGGEFSLSPEEAVDSRWVARDELMTVSPLNGNSKYWADLAFSGFEGKRQVLEFDA